MTIGVMAPFLNERIFAKAWIADVSKFADEIITADTGSDDGTTEILEQEGIRVLNRRKQSNNFYREWNTGREGIIRNDLKSRLKTDFIVPLDMDELVGEDFIALLKELKANPPTWHFARFVHLMFWRDLNTLRKRSLKPLLFFKGRFYPLRNWRGKYPNKIPRLFRNIPEIGYSTDPRHCMLQYKNFGRLSYYLPGMCQDFEIPFHHLHYSIPHCKSGNMDWELDDKVPTQPYDTCRYFGSYPPEIYLIEGVAK